MDPNKISIGEEVRVESTKMTENYYRQVLRSPEGMKVRIRDVRDDGYKIIDTKGRSWAVEDLKKIEDSYITANAELRPL